MKKNRAIILMCTLLISIVAHSQTYTVGHSQITYSDPARAGRSIQTEIYYPAATAGTGVPVSSGTFPLIVFGHGFVMAWDAYQNFWDDLVLQGYIVAFPRTEGSISPSHAEFGKDLAFLITKMQSESATNPSSIFYNHINSKSAIMGHSMGGGSSFLAAENNTTITTMISFAAANTTPSSISAARQITVPTLVFSGENDCVAPAATHQVPMYDSLASACKSFISIKGAAHCEFANYNFNCAFGQSTCSPSPTITRTQQQDATSDFLKLWLDYYLKDNCSAWTSFNDSLSVSPRINSNQSCAISNPVITQLGSVLTSTLATTYQWYLNGIIIPGATSQNYTTTGIGNYHVEVTYFNACPYPSNTISFVATGMSVHDLHSEFILSPNPSTDFIQVNFIAKNSEEITFQIMNTIGQLLLETKMNVKEGDVLLEKFMLNDFKSGLYFMNVQSVSFKHTEKIIKK